MGNLSIANSIRARGLLVLVTASMGLYLLLLDRGLAQNNQGQNDQGIKLGVLNGTYSLHITGYVPDSSGNMVPLAVAGRVAHFANGTNGTELGVATASVNGQSRWGQLVGDRHPDQPAISNAALYSVPYAGRQYHQ
jgi:hypothetical protein